MRCFLRHLSVQLLIVSSISAIAQKKELFFDYKWEPSAPELARFYSNIQQTDSGWLRKDYYVGTSRLQMQALFSDSELKIKNGHYFYFHANETASHIGKMINNKKQGICIQYHSNGMIADSANYHDDRPVGSRVLWHRNGYMSDSIYHQNDSLDVHLSWFENGSISSAGFLLRAKHQGKWKYYHPNGTISAEEVYKNGIALSKNYYDESGIPISDTSKANTEAVFKNGGQKGWTNYMLKNLYWPRGYQFVNGTKAVVVVSMTINEEGKPQDVEVVVPFHPEFDKIALDFMRKSPAWIPAVEHNRKVKAKFRQAVTFQME